MDEEILVELWYVAKDFIPVKQREEAAYQFVQVIDERGLDLHSITGNDAYLDKVVAELSDVDMEDGDMEE